MPQPARRILPAVIVLATLAVSPAAWGATITVSSSDIPKDIPDINYAGITSVLMGPNLTNLTDVNLIFDELRHTSISDLHIELRSPSGTTAVLVLAFSENGIMSGQGWPSDFVGTTFDDQAPVNLTAGSAPFTGSFNINHSSVGNNPLSVFNGEDALGTWTLFVSDRAPSDTGTLKGWSIQFTGTSPAAVPEPSSLLLAGLGGMGLLGTWRRRADRRRAAVKGTRSSE